MKSKHLIYFITSFLIFVENNSYYSYGQNIESICKPEILNYTKQAYNAQYQNWNISQDNVTKFMYFANSKGLLEYDGSEWKVYELPQKQKVRSVLVNKEGKIYTGGLGEFGFWSPDKKGNLIYHSLKNLVPDKSFQNEEIWNILVTPRGIIFQSFGFIYLYKPENNQVVKLNNPGTILFLQEVKNRFFVEVIDNGLYELDLDKPIKEQFTLIKGSEFLGNKSVNTILPFHENSILIGTNKGIYIYDFQSFKELNKRTNDFIIQNQLNRGLFLGNNLYAFGTILNGVIVTNQSGEIIQHFNKKSGLQNNTVLSLSKDADGNLWVGMDKGIDLIGLSSPLKYFNDLEGRLGTVYDVAIHEGNIYLGTNQGVFYSKLSQKQANFQLISNTQGQVWDLEVIDNQLLCGHNSGTFLIENNQANLISRITGGYVIKKLKSNPNLLIQGTYTNLCLYRKSTNGKWQFDHELAGFSVPIRQLEEDDLGNIWVNKASNELISLHLSKDYRKIITKKNFNSRDFIGAELFSLNNQICLKIANGILKYSQKQQRFILSNEFQKSSIGQNIRKIFPFSTHNLVSKDFFVLRNDGGLSYINSEGKEKIIPIKKNQWVDDYENIVQIDNENFLICTENGFVLLPGQIISKKAVNKIDRPLIRAIIIQDFPALNLAFRNQLEQTNLIFDYDQNNVTIDFATPNYGSTVNYSYLLENSTKNWSQFQNITHKDFNNLPPNTYIFHVKSDINPTESIITFEIKQPWYWNIWSRIFYLFLLIGIAFLSYQLHLKRLKIKQNQIREKLEKKLERQAEINSAEIIQLRNEQLEKGIISKSEELANSTMAVIKKNELLLTIKKGLSKIKTEPETRSSATHFNQVLHLVDSNISTEQDWQVFENNFNQVHEEFIKKLLMKYPNLTPSDVKLSAYLRMNLSTKEIAHLLNITNRSVELKRYRLRKKMNLATDVNLGEFMMAY